MRIESPTAPPLPTPPTSTPPAAETSPGQIRVIPLSAVPGVLTASGMRVSDILAAVLNAPKGHAVEVPCRDVSHAQCTVREVRRRASKNEIKVQSRTSREKVWIWRKQPALGAA